MGGMQACNLSEPGERWYRQGGPERERLEKDSENIAMGGAEDT